MRNRMWPAFLMVAVAIVGVSCGGGDEASAAGDDNTVLVFAAASLADAVPAIEMAFEEANPGIDVQSNLAGSSTLREQILEGAPADVFMSADESNMLRLVDAGEAPEDQMTFARNRLQIAVPVGNPAAITGIESLADPEALIGLCAEGVPCGDLAREALVKAGVEASIDTNEPDVRALLVKIEADELDAGIVYATDVEAAGDAVTGIDLPAEANVEATYHIARLTGSPNPSSSADFVAFVLSDEGQEILARFGFIGP